MRLGYFGGSFDPPHRGHLAVAAAARARFGLDRILLAPTGRQPLKPAGPAAPYADRLAMTQLLCAEAADLQASSLDAPHPDGSPNFTVDTLQTLRGTLAPATELFVLAGADAFLTLPQWRDPEALLQLASWIVVSRPGFPAAALYAMLGTLTAAQRAQVHHLPGIVDPTSATTLRRQLAAGEPTPGLPAAVAAYIAAHGLYHPT